ncbi:MAG: hypothetical protein A2Z34_10255 [Planctomycetes bacterium RBG_16_59_8]|nr:MAG: hypothetical protein A2Z34_10255 [Planctomycetes bacterium RBG_16_59_8]
MPDLKAADDLPSLTPLSDEEKTAADDDGGKEVEAEREEVKGTRETKTFRKTTSRLSAVGVKNGDRKTSRFAKTDSKSGNGAREPSGPVAVGSRAALFFFAVPFLLGIVAQGAKIASVDGGMLQKVGELSAKGLYQIPAKIADYREQSWKERRNIRTSRKFDIKYVGERHIENGHPVVVPPKESDPPKNLTKGDQIKMCEAQLGSVYPTYNMKKRALKQKMVGAKEPEKIELNAQLDQLESKEGAELNALKNQYKELTGREWNPDAGF